MAMMVNGDDGDGNDSDGDDDVDDIEEGNQGNITKTIYKQSMTMTIKNPILVTRTITTTITVTMTMAMAMTKLTFLLSTTTSWLAVTSLALLSLIWTLNSALGKVSGETLGDRCNDKW